MGETLKKCSFCGVTQSVSNPLIAGLDGHICEGCVRLANKVVTSWGRKKSLPELQSTLPTPAELKEQLDKYIIGQDLAKEIMCVAVYNHYKRYRDRDENKSICSNNSDDVEISKSNVLVIGPTGTGKTLIASTLARIVGVPFAVADATTLTQAGYVGEDVESIIQHLLSSAEGNVNQAQWGIVYVDEIDKLARSSESATGVRDVSGEGVQQALLKLVEGSDVRISSRGRRREGGEEIVVSTENILFIVGGAFQGLDRQVESRIKPRRTIGFHANEHPDQVKISQEQLIEEIEPDDLRRFGLIPEFIGRFPVIATLAPLDESALIKILTEPKNALVKQFVKLLAYDGIDLEISEPALKQIAVKAIERNTGARGLRSIIEHVLRPAMFSLPSRTDVQKIFVDVSADSEELVVIEQEASIDDGAERAFS